MTLPWHEALVLALTGERRTDLGRQEVPDIDAVLALIGDRTLGHHALPADLAQELPPARFAAVVVEIRKRRAISHAPAPGPHTWDADDRRLMADRPPHWG